MKKSILPVVIIVAFVAILAALYFAMPRQHTTQILTSKIAFRTMTFGDSHHIKAAPEHTAFFTDSIKYECPATGSDPITLQALQALLDWQVFGYGYELSPADFDDMARARFNTYVTEEYDIYGEWIDSIHGEYSAMAWEWTRHVETNVLYNTAYAINYEVSDYYYTGGAHGSSSLRYLSILLDGVHTRVLDFDDIFPNLNEQDTARIETMIMEQIQKADLTECLFETNKVPIAQNVSLSPEGVAFTYQQYEIMPYACDINTFTLPYSQLTGLVDDKLLSLFTQPSTATSHSSKKQTTQ